ncbi:hydroxysqualene dehydroxylase [Mariprofundus ferrooxydans]|uniref:hydroxysqualene dehydroxylase n=1 Tax=Mariprofundus ferrooxydans TaxID=314344 RepID=UPI00142FD82D|nr:FAD-dependent oxidoreductase [Mariprofundus ferrooxydans]
MTTSAAVIGGGLTGLTTAIRLAEQGISTELFEAAPSLGGRTRSFFEPTMQQLCDNGPHLLIGAYAATRRLLRDCNAEKHLHWQPSLSLPLWDIRRGHFAFQPAAKLPFAPALLLAAASMPEHSLTSSLAMLRLAAALQRKKPPREKQVAGWLDELRIPDQLVRDLLEPLCLGAMNEATETASTLTFRRVLKESFAGRDQARLGWFTAPLQTALIEPLAQQARQLGVQIHTGHRVRQLVGGDEDARVDGKSYDKVVVALPSHAADKLMHRQLTRETRAISNIHLWLRHAVPMPAPLIGCIDGVGQWYFDVSQQWLTTTPGKHICAVISADEGHRSGPDLVRCCIDELSQLCGMSQQPELIHSRIVSERRATTLVRPDHSGGECLPASIINACEVPLPGQLPATIESAVRRGEIAAQSCIPGHTYQPYPL